MRRSAMGKGNVKLFFTLVFLALVAFAAFKVIPVFVSNYELTDDIKNLAVQATVDHSSAEAVQNKVLDFAKDLSLPIIRENVSVQVGPKVTISLDYKVPLDLIVFTFDLHFTPSAENKAL
jgi:hypothetical protein